MPGSSRDHKGSYFRIIGNDKNTRQIFSYTFFGRNTHVGYSYMICKINYVMKSDS